MAMPMWQRVWLHECVSDLIELSDPKEK